VGALVYAVADLITMFHNDDWDANRMGVSVMALLTGLGFISARDNAASVQEHAIQGAAIAANTADAVVAKQVAVVAAQEVVAVKQEVANLTANVP
jgi:hypothetical protein